MGGDDDDGDTIVETQEISSENLFHSGPASWGIHIDLKMCHKAMTPVCWVARCVTLWSLQPYGSNGTAPPPSTDGGSIKFTAFRTDPAAAEQRARGGGLARARR
eukprot:COSAG01_NODE_98_length_26629_cov_56.866453_14_plen_104_part_00